jgi:hypothetical protein
MRKILASLLSASLLATPVQARAWQDQAAGVRPGAFVGAEIRLTLGGTEAARPVAALAMAPTQSRISGDGIVRTRIGEGIALDLTSHAKPTLTLAGIRADQALGLTSRPTTAHGRKLGLSDGAKVAIGVVAALAVGVGVLYVVKSNECDECDD